MELLGWVFKRDFYAISTKLGLNGECFKFTLQVLPIFWIVDVVVGFCRLIFDKNVHLDLMEIDICILKGPIKVGDNGSIPDKKRDLTEMRMNRDGFSSFNPFSFLEVKPPSRGKMDLTGLIADSFADDLRGLSERVEDGGDENATPHEILIVDILKCGIFKFIEKGAKNRITGDDIADRWKMAKREFDSIPTEINLGWVFQQKWVLLQKPKLQENEEYCVSQ